MLGQRRAAHSRSKLYKSPLVRIDSPVRHLLLPSHIDSSMPMTKKDPEHQVELLKLHKHVVILRQQWCGASHKYCKLPDADDERLKCFQQTRQDDLSRGLLPAWKIPARRRHPDQSTLAP